MSEDADLKRRIAFTIPGVPVAKARPRSDRNGFYTPAKTAALELSIAWLAREAMRGQPPFVEPVAIRISAYFKPPESLPKRRRVELRGAPHARRPDLDNVVKAVLDGCNAVAFVDDAQVCRLTATKRFAEEPRVIVEIAPCGSGAAK